MKILGTGLSGLVGTRIAELLPEIQFQDVSLDTGHDITDQSQVDKLISESDADFVLHMAAFTDVGKAEEERGNEDGIVWKVNVNATDYIANACKVNNKKLLYISTDYVFDGTSGPYAEEDKPMVGSDKGTWYGWSKLQGEVACKNHVPDCLIVRIAFPYRASFAGKPDFMRKIYKGLQDGTLYPQFTDQFVTPTFIDDIADAIGLLVKSEATGTYHVVGSSVLSPYDAAVIVAKTFDFDPNLVKEGSLEEFLKEQIAKNPMAGVRYPKNSTLKNDKMQKLLAQKNLQMHRFDDALQIIKQQGINI